MVETGERAVAGGTVLTYTVIYVPTPEFAGEAPYGLAVVETADGTRELLRVGGVDDHSLRIGGAVVYDHDDAHGAVYRAE
ncbi:MAG TPA: OB-fold domain-containing protein [Thermomicrobiaceae bacterium]|nr:OB-fold domain-containing protein [Thermomicrobiaceae bacterium]